MGEEELEVETYTVLAPGELFFAPSISVRAEHETDYDSVEKLADEEIAALEDEDGFEVLARTDDFLLDQFPVEEVLLRWETEEEVMFQRRHYAILDEVAYTLVLTFVDDTGVGVHSAGEKILRSFNPPEKLIWG